jgi:hypothetical protein
MKKYAFFRKERDEMTSSERRWKWVLREHWPEDMQKFFAMLETKKSKKKTKDEDQKDEKDKKVEKKDETDIETQ